MRIKKGLSRVVVGLGLQGRDKIEGNRTKVPKGAFLQIHSINFLNPKFSFLHIPQPGAFSYLTIISVESFLFLWLQFFFKICTCPISTRDINFLLLTHSLLFTTLMVLPNFFFSNQLDNKNAPKGK